MNFVVHVAAPPFTHLQHPQPLVRQLRAAANRFVVHDREVCFAAEVLRDRDGVVHVQHDVPVAAGHEDGLAGFLEDFDGLAVAGPVELLAAGINFAEPGDRLVSLLSADGTRDFQQLLGRVGGEEAPPLVSDD